MRERRDVADVAIVGVAALAVAATVDKADDLRAAIAAAELAGQAEDLERRPARRDRHPWPAAPARQLPRGIDANAVKSQVREA